MVEYREVHKSFGNVHVLKGIDIRIDKPGVLAILGPNGSGKTTMIKCLLGMVIPDSGSLEVGGKSIKRQWDYREKLDYLPQIARFPDNLTVEELFRMIIDLRGQKPQRDDLVELFKLQPYLKKKLGNLSGGTRQKVNLVLAFMFDNPMLILDEPTAGLDPVSLITLKKLIQAEREKGKIILLTTHIMSLVEEMADDIIFLLEGRVYFRGNLNKLKERVGEDGLEEAIATLISNEYVQDS